MPTVDKTQALDKIIKNHLCIIAEMFYFIKKSLVNIK